VEGDVSGILECERVFQVPLADGWTVRGEPGRSYDISHSELDVGVNISVHPRGAIGDDLGAAVLRFAGSVGADPNRLSVVHVPARDHSRAFVRFEADGRSWLAAFVDVGDAAVLVTSNSAVDDDAAFSAGELVVASLGPVVKRRLFRKK
jgi:hypothetical protein